MPCRLQFAFFALLLLLGVGNLAAGTIRGTIRAVTVAEKGDQSKSGNSYQSRRYRFLEKIDYSDLTGFVVSIDGVERRPLPNEAPPRASVSQNTGNFVPHVLPIVAGTEVAWPNRDDIFHNVFSMSETQQFDLGYYKKSDDAKSLVFDVVGKIDVFCSIHSKMNCVVLVLPNPWFSISDKRGRYEIEEIPSGTYTLKAWHERLPAKFFEVAVPENGEAVLDIVMGFSELPKI